MACSLNSLSPSEVEKVVDSVSLTRRKYFQQAGAELGQAQLKLELDLTLIFFNRFGLIELTGW